MIIWLIFVYFLISGVNSYLFMIRKEPLNSHCYIMKLSKLPHLDFFCLLLSSQGSGLTLT